MLGKGNDCLFSNYVKVPLYEGSPDSVRLRVPCGTCYNCKRKKSNEWRMRLEMESAYWDEICFITLTYSPEEVPVHFVQTDCFDDTPDLWRPLGYDSKKEYQEVLTLDREEVKKFFKRLRKHLDYKIRYFCVGEYGTQRKRPHLHAIVFGLKEDDWHFILESWKHGFVTVSPLKDAHCAYAAGYVQKKLYGDLKNPFKVPEFLNASQHLGERWLLSHLADFDDEHPYINFKGYKQALPRTFSRKLQELGKLKNYTVLQLYNMQFEEYKQLHKACDDKGISLSQYFHGRIIDAQAKARKAMASRDKNKEF